MQSIQLTIEPLKPDVYEQYTQRTKITNRCLLLSSRELPDQVLSDQKNPGKKSKYILKTKTISEQVIAIATQGFNRNVLNHQYMQ